MANDEYSPSKADRVSWNQLIAFGMGGLIPIALFNIAGQLIGLLGNISLGLGATLLSAILFIPRLWDAFSDPLIGHFSDNMQTRWGRRRPFILVGGIIVALSFVAMWWVPRGEWIREIFVSESSYNWFQLAYILFGLLIFYTACNLFEIPHGALGMEMSKDYHERTRLFSAKSFLGNLFALGTPWLIFFSTMEIFRGPSGDLIDGMRYVSLLIAVVLIPMSYWWFVTLKEPGYEAAKSRPKAHFWSDMATTGSNRTFLYLTFTIFILAAGFQLVGNFNNYITIFYLYGGDTSAASSLLGLAGTVWAITALVAVVPLNWVSKRIGKKLTLLLAIGLMCAAQLSKIVCYDPVHPYLVLIPTVLLSAGMLMFFTLGSSMVGDVCDEDELHTGSRREGTYYSVFWWFVKLGTAFAILLSGLLLDYTKFDQKQNVYIEALSGKLAAIRNNMQLWNETDASLPERQEEFDRDVKTLILKSGEAVLYFEGKGEATDDKEHIQGLVIRMKDVDERVKSLESRTLEASADLQKEIEQISASARELKAQSPETLYKLRVVEIGLPLLLSIASVYFCLKYPLSEARCYEIKHELEQRHKGQ